MLWITNQHRTTDLAKKKLTKGGGSLLKIELANGAVIYDD